MDIEVGEAGWTNEAFGKGKEGKMPVFFHTVQVKNKFRSQQAGRPIFEEQVFITKIVPGGGLTIDRKIRETDKEEYPREWAHWENKKQNLVIGTPLDAWPALSETQKAEFKALNIFTVDQFAALPDGTGQKIMGFSELRTQARAFIMAGRSTEVADRMAKQDAEMAELKAQIAELTKPKMGRPKKESADV